jgi:hypothetical protein
MLDFFHQPAAGKLNPATRNTNWQILQALLPQRIPVINLYNTNKHSQLANLQE